MTNKCTALSTQSIHVGPVGRAVLLPINSGLLGWPKVYKMKISEIKRKAAVRGWGLQLTIDILH